jgi:hypothetical protein
MVMGFFEAGCGLATRSRHQNVFWNVRVHGRKAWWTTMPVMGRLHMDGDSSGSADDALVSGTDVAVLLALVVAVVWSDVVLKCIWWLDGMVQGNMMLQTVIGTSIAYQVKSVFTVVPTAVWRRLINRKKARPVVVDIPDSHPYHEQVLALLMVELGMRTEKLTVAPEAKTGFATVRPSRDHVLQKLSISGVQGRLGALDVRVSSTGKSAIRVEWAPDMSTWRGRAAAMFGLSGKADVTSDKQAQLAAEVRSLIHRAVAARGLSMFSSNASGGWTAPEPVPFRSLRDILQLETDDPVFAAGATRSQVVQWCRDHAVQSVAAGIVVQVADFLDGLSPLTTQVGRPGCRSPQICELAVACRCTTGKAAAKLGVLAAGSPGLMKTSFAFAMCHSLGFSSLFVPNIGAETDCTFREAMRKVPPFSMVLLDDLDAGKVDVTAREDSSKPVRSKNLGACDDSDSDDQENGHVSKGAGPTGRSSASRGSTMSTILSILDGSCTPEGVVFFITTNRWQALDSAILRDGRIHARWMTVMPKEPQYRRMIALHRPAWLADVETTRDLARFAERFDGVLPVSFLDILHQASSPAEAIDILGRKFKLATIPFPSGNKQTDAHILRMSVLDMLHAVPRRWGLGKKRPSKPEDILGSSHFFNTFRGWLWVATYKQQLKGNKEQRPQLLDSSPLTEWQARAVALELYRSEAVGTVTDDQFAQRFQAARRRSKHCLVSCKQLQAVAKAHQGMATQLPAHLSALGTELFFDAVSRFDEFCCEKPCGATIPRPEACALRANTQRSAGLSGLVSALAVAAATARMGSVAEVRGSQGHDIDSDGDQDGDDSCSPGQSPLGRNSDGVTSTTDTLYAKSLAQAVLDTKDSMVGETSPETFGCPRLTRQELSADPSMLGVLWRLCTQPGAGQEQFLSPMNIMSWFLERDSKHLATLAASNAGTITVLEVVLRDHGSDVSTIEAILHGVVIQAWRDEHAKQLTAQKKTGKHGVASSRESAPDVDVEALMGNPCLITLRELFDPYITGSRQLSFLRLIKGAVDGGDVHCSGDGVAAASACRSNERGVDLGLGRLSDMMPVTRARLCHMIAVRLDQFQAQDGPAHGVDLVTHDDMMELCTACCDARGFTLLSEAHLNSIININVPVDFAALKNSIMMFRPMFLPLPFAIPGAPLPVNELLIHGVEFVE